MLELASERGVKLPADTAESLADHMLVASARRLEDYLERFAITLSVMQDREALRRITRELVEDHAAEGVRYLEARFCPLLNMESGLGAQEVLEAVLEGAAEGEAETGTRAQIIICALRTLAPASSEEMAELAIAYRDRGVCGFDIAGAEAGYPVRDHRASFDRAAEAGIPITIHAGEGFGPESIRQALELGHAIRIGHGTRLYEDRSLLEVVRDQRIPLEVCLTSNVQTRVATSYREHPAGRYMLAGIPVAISTDNRLMSGVTLVDEFEHARDAFQLGWSELTALARTTFEHAFVDPQTRDELLERFDAEAAALPEAS